MNCVIHAAPLQGFTDFRFRKVLSQLFEGIDHFYAPYIRLNTAKDIKKATAEDIKLENNAGYNLIPQVLTNNSADFLNVAKYVENLGYKELNWNLGCPYPMVTNKGMGAGMLNNADAIDNLLDPVFTNTNLQISIKMRLGLESPESIFSVLPVLNKYPVKNITIHPRIGKQRYKGNVDLDRFEQCLELTRHVIIYNGDIRSVDDYEILSRRFPTINHWMIGRGVIIDPFLPKMIKANQKNYPENRDELMRKMHDLLFYEYEQKLLGEAHILLKMKSFWNYWCLNYPGRKTACKKIKKAKSFVKYNDAVGRVFSKT